MTYEQSASTQPDAERAARIRALNDVFRHQPDQHSVHVTAGVSALGLLFIAAAMRAVRTFDSFDAGNDPYGEHDFGSVFVAGKKLFWKIDYYDRTLEYGSPHPDDPAQTTRMLTIMLADEY